MSNPLIEINQVYKQYDKNIVLDDINLKITAGEIHALIGDNGAGKTTLVQLLANLESPSKGTIRVGKRKLDNPKVKISYAGQDIYFIDDFSVRQNIVLGDEQSVLNTFINWKKTDEKIFQVMKKYQIYVDLNKRFKVLSLSEQRKVALLRALYKKPKILVLDEPTVGLPLKQQEEFLPIFKSFIHDKITVIFSTRSKEFAKAVATSYSLLKNGTIVWTKINKTGVNSKQIQHKKWNDLIEHKKPHPQGEHFMLYAEDISFNARNYQTLENIDLVVKKGEIHGVYDSTNNSSSLIADIIIGKRKSQSARIFLANDNISNKTQIKRYNLGLELVPENFLYDATISNYSLVDNFILWHHSKTKYLHAGVIRRDEIKHILGKILKKYQFSKFITTNSIASTLSNGELQKFVLARTLENDAKVIILVNPLMHLDDHAATLIINKIIELQNKGTSFILIDCDPYLLELLANKVSIIKNGRIIATLENQDIKSEILNNPLTLANKSSDILDKQIQIAKSTLSYKKVSQKQLKWRKFINQWTFFRDSIIEWLENMRVRVSGG